MRAMTKGRIKEIRDKMDWIGQRMMALRDDADSLVQVRVREGWCEHLADFRDKMSDISDLIEETLDD